MVTTRKQSSRVHRGVVSCHSLITTLLVLSVGALSE